MEITQEIGEKLIRKIEKILSRKIYIYDKTGSLLDDFLTKIDFKALESIQKDRAVTEQREGRFFTWEPIRYDENILGAICVSDENKEKSLDLTKLSRGLAEALIYEEFLVSNIYIANDLRSYFLKEILFGNIIKTTEEAIEQGDILGVNLRPDQAVMILKIENLFEDYSALNSRLSPEEKRTKFQEYLKEIEEDIAGGFGDRLQNAVVYLGEGKFLILKDLKNGEISTSSSVSLLRKKGECLFNHAEKKFSGKVTVGIGQYYPGLMGLRKSYEDANIALVLGKKVLGSSGHYHILDVSLFLGLWGSLSGSRKSELSFQVLKNLLLDKDLLKTVTVFLDCGMNLTEASKKLHLHRNTLIYRLSKTTELIGLNPRNFQDAVQIKLGLMIQTAAKTY